MKSLQDIIQEKLNITKGSLMLEKLKIGSKTKVNSYNYCPKDKDELKKLLEQLLGERGKDADLNDIDTSNIEDMSFLFFKHSKFNGDISNWNVSNVTNMKEMFYNSEFNEDISKWDVSNVINMEKMFFESEFNRKEDLKKWKINKICNMTRMFDHSPLEGKEPDWYKNF